MMFQPDPDMKVTVEEPTGSSTSAETASPLDVVTQCIGQDKSLLMTSTTSKVYVTHYKWNHTQVVKKLTFFQLGNTDLPDMSPYASTCTYVVFRGPVCSVKTAIEIICQLPKVTKVAFYIGPSHGGPYTESAVEFFTPTPPCPHVKALKIVLDQDYFYSCRTYQDTLMAFFNRCHLNSRQQSMMSFVTCIINHSIHSFRSLQRINGNLPDYPSLPFDLKNLFDARPGLQSTIQFYPLMKIEENANVNVTA